MAFPNHPWVVSIKVVANFIARNRRSDDRTSRFELPNTLDSARRFCAPGRARSGIEDKFAMPAACAAVNIARCKCE